MRKLLTLVVMLILVLTAATPALAQSQVDPIDNPPLPDNGNVEKPPPDPGNKPTPPDNGGRDNPPPGTRGNPPPPDRRFPGLRSGPGSFSTVVVCGESEVVARAEPSLSVIEDCGPADEPLHRADIPVLADVPREAGSSGSKSFRGFSETLGGGGSTGIPPAAAVETGPPASEPEVDPVASRSASTGSSDAADDDVSDNGAAREDKPEKDVEPGPLPDTGGVPLLALGVGALAAGGLLIRRLVR